MSRLKFLFGSSDCKLQVQNKLLQISLLSMLLLAKEVPVASWFFYHMNSSGSNQAWDVLARSFVCSLYSCVQELRHKCSDLESELDSRKKTSVLTTVFTVSTFSYDQDLNEICWLAISLLDKGAYFKSVQIGRMLPNQVSHVTFQARMIIWLSLLLFIQSFQVSYFIKVYSREQIVRG